jgi:hypothetical protein
VGGIQDEEAATEATNSVGGTQDKETATKTTSKVEVELKVGSVLQRKCSHQEPKESDRQLDQKALKMPSSSYRTAKLNSSEPQKQPTSTTPQIKPKSPSIEIYSRKLSHHPQLPPPVQRSLIAAKEKQSKSSPSVSLPIVNLKFN